MNRPRSAPHARSPSAIRPPLAAGTAWRLLAEAMEPRILHSADLAPLLWSGDAALHGQTTPAEVAAPASVTRSEIVFVDAGLPDADSLIKDLQAQREAGRPIEVVTIGAGEDGLALIGATLSARQDLGAVHVLAHGSDGVLQLGSSRLDAQTLMQQAGAIAAWGQALTGDADLLLYGCDLAQSAVGQQLVQDLAALTGADVAASTDLTGASAYGGNWVLEYSSGSIEAMLAPSRLLQSQWQGVLATYSVTTTSDVVGVGLLPGTLRWAISQANTNPGTDTIVFTVDGVFNMAAGSGGDNNSGGDFDITGSVRIVGNGSARTIINGNGLDRVFDVRAGTVSLSGLTIQGGASNSGAGIRVTANADVSISDAVIQNNVGSGSSKGGGIYNAGNLTLLRTLVQNNGDTSAGDVDGAGIYNAGSSTLNARDVEIRGNVAANDKDGGGLYVLENSTAVLQNVTVSDNQAKRGGGVWASGDVSLTNVTLSGNTGRSQGGAVWFDKSDLTLDHVSIVGNTSASAGGLYMHDSSVDVTVGSSLFAANSGGNSSHAATSAGYNLSDDGSPGFAAATDRKNVATGLLALGSLASNGGFGRTLAIGSASLARDSANPATSLTADQRGTAYFGRADIGAYEYSSVGFAPTITAIADQTLPEDTPSGLIAFTVADAQSPAATLIVTATSSNAALLPTASLVLGGSGGSRNISFTPVANASGTTTITVTVSDGGFTTSTSFELTVQAVNDAPLLTLPGPLAVNEDGMLSFAGASAPGVSDVDAGSGPLQVSLAVAHGRLTLTVTTGLSFTVGTGSDNAGMVFSGSQSAVNAALASLQYRPGSDYNGADSLDLTVNDLGNSGSGGARSASGSVALTVNAVNDAPTLTLPGAQSTPLATPLPFSSAGGNAIRVADVDSAGSVLELSLTTIHGAGGGTLSFGSLAGLTLVSGTGTLDSTVVLRGTAVDLNAALETLSFTAGTASASQVDVTIDDLGATGLGGARQTSGSIAIAIGADALPVVTLGAPAASYTEGGAALALAPALTLSDADNATLASAHLRISGGYAGAQDELHFINDGVSMGNIVGSYSAGTLSLSSAGQTATVAEWQAALRAVSYANSSEAPSTATRTFSLSVNDGVADSASRQWTLAVAAVNDAPTLAGAIDFRAIAEDAASPAGMLVSALLAGHLSDVDDAALAGVAIVGVDDSHGSWQYTLDGGATWTAIGAVSDASARLLAADPGAAVRFLPAADWNGTVAGGLRLRAWDQTSGSAGALADTRSNGGSTAFSTAVYASSITVTAVNDAPVLATGIADQAGSVHTAFNFTLPAASFTDVDAGDTLTYSARLASGAALPTWLHFDASTQTFSGTPGDADAGTLSVRVTAADSNGANASDDFQLVLTDSNDEPVLVGTVPDQSANEDQAFVFTLPAGLFTDINPGDSLSYTLTLDSGAALPAWLHFDALGQVLSGTPGNADVGSLALRVTATDTHGATAHADFLLTVANVNDAPVFGGPIAAQTATQGRAFTFTLPAGLFSDVDAGDSLALGARLSGGAALPAWLRFDASTQTFTGTPANADVGTIAVAVTATDNNGATASGNFTLTVANVNDAPAFSSAIAAQTATQGRAFTFTLPAGLVADVDAGDTLSFSARLASGAALPAWLRFDAATQTFSGTPANADVGAVAVAVTATDTSGASARSVFTLTVANVNDAPVFVGSIAAQAATPGQGYAFTLPAGLFTDIDAGDTLTLSVRLSSGAALPGWLRFDAATQTFSGTPAKADADAITVAVTATDAGGATAAGSFTLTVAHVNDAPVFVGPIAAQAATQGQGYAFTLPAGLFTDSDAGDTLTLSARLASGAALPGWLRFDAATQTFSGTPANADVGAIAVAVTATDTHGETASGSFTLTVANVNDAPVFSGAIAAQTATQDRPFTFAMPAGLAVDIDAGDTLSFSARLASGAALPAWLHFDAATQTFSGTPANADVGRLVVQVTAADNHGATTQADFMLTVANVNDAPVFVGPIAAQAATQDQGFAFTLPAGLFTDIDAGDTLALGARLASGAALPAWLRFDAATRTFSGTPANADVGALTVTVTATDAGGATAAGSFTLTVANVNDAPLFGAPIAAQTATQGQAFAFTLPAGLVTDIDAGDTPSFSAGLASGAALPAWLHFDAATQTFSGTPANADVGNLSVRLTASDGHGGSASTDFALTVLNVNDAPQAGAPLAGQATLAGTPVKFTVPAEAFVDVDAGDTLTYAATLADGSKLPAWLTFDAEHQRFTAAPALGDVGRWMVLVTATDAAGAGTHALFVMDIASPPMPAVAPVLPPAAPPDVRLDEPAAAPVDKKEERSSTAAEASAKTLSAGVARTTAQPDSSGLETRLATDAAVAPTEARRFELAAETSTAATRMISRSDAVLAASLIPQYADLSAAPLMQALRSDDLLRKLDELRRQMAEPVEEHRKVVASSIAITGGLSIGYVVWLVRGGVLVSSMLSALPAWQMIDPLPVLAAAGAARRRRGGMPARDNDPEVERLFDGHDSASGPASRPPPTDAVPHAKAQPRP